MAVNPLKALIFLAGGLVAALGVAWFAGAFAPLSGETPVAADNSGRMTAKGDRPAAPGPAGEGPQAEPPPATAEVIPPSFDILRVEPDGSILIAGRAAPDSTVEILSGSQVIGKADVGGEGDFVAVLDEPLKPGDYQVVLRSTAPGNIVAASPETAIVSIPSQKDGEVLALVEQPGEASRLITVPEPEASAPGAEAPQAPAATQPAPESQAPAAEAPPAAAQEGPAPVGQGGDRLQAEAPQPASPQEHSTVATDPAASRSEAEASSSEPAPDGSVARSDGADATLRTAQSPGESPQPGSEMAAAPANRATPQPAERQSSPSPAAQPKIAVEAVEIEGRKVFVAGVAEPGSQVRVYANEVLLGESEAGEGGRFLVETERDLPLGDYIVRADVLGSDGSVIARAAVPFEREEGESIAAVAPPSSPSTNEPVATSPEQSDKGTVSAPLVNEPAPADQAQGGATASGGSDVATPADQVQRSPAPSGEDSVAVAPAEPSAPAGPGSTDAAGQEAVRAESAAGDTLARDEAGTPAAQRPAAAGEGEAQAAGEPAPNAAGTQSQAAAEPPTVIAPKLEKADGAVIIRRGDNLWRISRRVYGRGVRYTTIYLANQDQISDPDRIWPGQVFAVPGKTPHGETADLEAIGDRATTMPPKEQ